MKELIEVGGSAFLIPAVLFGLVLYAIRGVFGLHGRRSQHRKEFLELWDASRSKDDLWLEVAVRHLFGTYLPARVIRLAMAQPDKSQALLDLCELWPLFRFDPDSQTVRWLHSRHETRAKRKFGRVLLLTGYFFLFILAALSAFAMFRFGPNTLSGWSYGIFAVAVGFCSVMCLMRADTIEIAATVGDDWLIRINCRANSKGPAAQIPLQSTELENAL